MRTATICTAVGLSLFAVSTSAIAQDMNGMNGNSMGPKTMTHKPMTKKQKMMMQKQQMMKKQQTMQHKYVIYGVARSPVWTVCERSETSGLTSRAMDQQPRSADSDADFARAWTKLSSNLL
jgi:hypothetical protein